MQIIGHGTETYLYLSGLSTLKDIPLYEGIVLAPVTSKFHYEKVSKLLKNDVDLAVAAVSGRTIGAQLHIRASDAKQLAIMAWNAVWDCILLGAIFHCEVMDNIQCDKPVEELENATFVHVTNYNFRAVLSKPYQLTDDDEKWIAAHYAKAYKLMDNGAFSLAACMLASYRWYRMPRVQLSVLWSGIEALFEVRWRIRSRLSLAVANYLAGGDSEKEKEIIDNVKKLYKSRSEAVHGSQIKGDEKNLVSQSALLLNRLIRRCAELGSLPDTKKLVFPNTYGTAES